MALPPWLQISPRDYLAAVEAGTRAGLSIREANQQAWENAQRMQLAQENAQRQDLANRLQQERLDQYRQQELANARSRIGESQNALQARIALGQQGLALRSQGLDEAQKRFEESQKTAKEREDDRQAQREFRNKMAEQMMQLRENAADRTKGVPHYFTGPKNAQYVVMPGSTNAVPIALPKPPTKPSGSLLSGVSNLAHNLTGRFLGSPLPTQSDATATNAAPQNPYKVGAQYGKLRYKGGDPNDESNWEPVQ